jgi:hypothetical protein
MHIAQSATYYGFDLYISIPNSEKKCEVIISGSVVGPQQAFSLFGWLVTKGASCF